MYKEGIFQWTSVQIKFASYFLEKCNKLQWLKLYIIEVTIIKKTSITKNIHGATIAHK